MERGGSRRGANPESDGKVRDFGNWERKGPLSPVPGAAVPIREGRVRNNDAPRERRSSPAWGEGQARSQEAGSQEGSRPPRGEFRERPQVERAPTAAEKDNQWRARMKPDAPAKSTTPTPEPSAPSSPAQPSAPAMRPRLNLAKRTVSEAASPSAASASSDSKASPFGAARPIDTAAREREVEEKRQIALREKKEADDKARAEKAKAAAQKAEKKDGQAEENGKAGDGEKENGDVPKPSFSILQHVDDEGKETGDDDSEVADASANGEIADDKAAKPKEFIREPPKGPKNDKGAWRRKSSTPNTPKSPVGPTGEKVEEDGWSTVTAPPRKGGKGRGGARVTAS